MTSRASRTLDCIPYAPKPISHVYPLDLGKTMNVDTTSSTRKILEIRVLDVKEKHKYTIPSFSAIDMQLQHVLVECWELDPIDYLDVFFRVGSDLPRLHDVDSTLPAYATVFKGCIVPVSMKINGKQCLYSLSQNVVSRA